MRMSRRARRSRSRSARALAAGVATCLAALCASVLGGAADAAAEQPQDEIVRALQQEVAQLREENAAMRQENAASDAALHRLEEKVAQMEAALPAQAEAGGAAQAAVAAPSGRLLPRLFGDNRFVVTGWGAAGYDWETAGENENTFGATISPIFLFRVGDRVLFEAEPELELATDGTEVNLEYAQADVILNDYATLVAGKFLLPFGTFIQQLHPAWINKLVSNPLPYLEEGGLIPFSDTGFQLRGGTRFFQSEGVDLSYSAYVTNGPRFEDDEPDAPFVSNNLDDNHGKGFGARLGVYPLPLASELGRLEIGASTYDGTWDEGNNLWFTSWGIDGAYRWEELELRGEYLQTRRELLGAPNDHRDGWYVQAAYELSRLDLPVLRRTGLVLRYSGLSQRKLFDEAGDLVRVGDPQQIAFGLDYWLTPSVAGKVEYDFGFAKGANDSHAIRAQLAVGF